MKGNLQLEVEEDKETATVIWACRGESLYSTGTSGSKGEGGYERELTEEIAVRTF